MHRNHESLEDTVWDVAVIGGGPAGMMSAGRAASLGAKVILIEKNDTLGKKLLITGGGRCNLTNAEFDIRKFLSNFKDSDKFLFSSFSQFNSKDTLDFFNTRGMETKLEALGRVFPASNTAQSVWDTLFEYLKQGNVTVLSDTTVLGFENIPGEIKSIKLSEKQKILAKSFVLATGGKSRPETGSTGDGFKWLKEIGHNVSESKASLVPIATKEDWVKKLAGVSLPEVKITILQNNEKQFVKKGKILFTHFGLSGPTILNLSHDIGELLKYDDVFISLDLLPSLDHGQLNSRLQEIFSEKSNRKIKNVLGEIITGALVEPVIELSGIDADKPTNSITRDERLDLIQTLKNLKITVDKLLGEDKAIITSGGVSLDEIDFKTMRSNLFKNLYVVGDLLDIDRPSGGYSLQLCWTTGYIAGSNALKS